jgi:hypothetical protein
MSGELLAGPIVQTIFALRIEVLPMVSSHRSMVEKIPPCSLASPAGDQ